MKLNRLETHDRLGHFIEDQSVNIWKGAEDCLKRNKLSLALQERSPYIYIFAHPRTESDGVTKKMFWQPRLTKPEAQTNSYLFRAKSKTDSIEVCWILPPEEIWKQFEKGKVTENELILWSIDQFKNNKKKLEARDIDDMNDTSSRRIYREIHREQMEDVHKRKILKPKIWEPCSFSSSQTRPFP